MRELNFTEKNLRNRWLGVNSIWYLIQGETKRFVKRRLEGALYSELSTLYRFSQIRTWRT